MSTPSGTNNSSKWASQHANDGLSKYGGRDMMGYSDKPPSPRWPNGAKVALNFVINYEEGSEKCILHGDNESESLLSEIVGAEPIRKYIVRTTRFHRRT